MQCIANPCRMAKTSSSSVWGHFPLTSETVPKSRPFYYIHFPQWLLLDSKLVRLIKETSLRSPSWTSLGSGQNKLHTV